ncbi:hypothetical protein GCM10010259_67450 [Streptomyces daghestanicus]|uniref:DDE Tnp4 domain-containing protein n=1 Tax=Streptomyces daghestanicus TaxID=66885 RepID=A0ABQ3Q806_9ACTN|nr:hypothetical protein GCM10010259_67450 [Streptomyces daghestanicus]GHI33401.1 hypothetical protein Sdagh_51310 [Streptomyces daghestanicus]
MSGPALAGLHFAGHGLPIFNAARRSKPLLKVQESVSPGILMPELTAQVLADPSGRLLWASPALPGALHDIRAAREHGAIAALAEAGTTCWADKGHRGAGGTVRVPHWGRWKNLSASQKAVNRSHAKIRALVEQAVATLKSWRLLRKIRCSTTRITSLVQAVLTLHLTSSDR